MRITGWARPGTISTTSRLRSKNCALRWLSTQPTPGRTAISPAFFWSRTILPRPGTNCGGPSRPSRRPSCISNSDWPKASSAICPPPPRNFEMGLAEGQLGNLPAAASEFRSAIQLNPRFATAYDRLGVALRRQDDHAGAVAAFRKAIEADPKDPEAQYDLGLELKAAGDVTGAVAAFRRAIELRPDFEKARYNLGLALR